MVFGSGGLDYSGTGIEERTVIMVTKRPRVYLSGIATAKKG